MFTIREVNLTDSHAFLGSDNIHSIALSHKLWDGVGLLDFTKTYSRGEYGHKYYSGRRMWDGLRRMKPSLLLPAEYGNLKDDKPSQPWGKSTYPFSIAPDQKLSPSSWFAAHRSHYEGTPYDTSKGLAAGVFGTPDRYPTVGAPGDPGKGSWERTVSIYRTTYTWVVQASASAPDATAGTIWWGPADSSKTVFVPLMVSMGSPPLSYTLGRQGAIDRRSSYWAHRYIQNLAQIRYSYMIRDIRAASIEWEDKAAALQTQLRANRSTPTQIKQALEGHASAVLHATWQLADDLMLKYADGVLTTPQSDYTVACEELGYPGEWLKDKEVNFTNGPSRLPPPA